MARGLSCGQLVPIVRGIYPYERLAVSRSARAAYRVLNHVLMTAELLMQLRPDDRLVLICTGAMRLLQQLLMLLLLRLLAAGDGGVGRVDCALGRFLVGIAKRHHHHRRQRRRHPLRCRSNGSSSSRDR